MIDVHVIPYAYGEEYQWAEERALPGDVTREIFTSNASRWLGLA